MNSTVESLQTLPNVEPNLVFGGIYCQKNDEHEASVPAIQPECDEDEPLDTSSLISLRSPRTPCRWSPSLSRAFRDRYCNRSKLRTPRTMTRLMQQHRDNERHRHRGLNASIKDITGQIPGYEAAAKETKIVKLQRIIHYICHLEGHIQGLCQELAVGLQYKNLFLSPHLPKKNEAKRRRIMTGPSPSKHGKSKASKAVNRIQHVSSSTDRPVKPPLPAAAKKAQSLPFGQRLKVSSPTIDSTTTDDFLFTIVPKELDLSQLIEDDTTADQDLKLSDLHAVEAASPYSMCSDPKPGPSHVAKDAVLTDAWECLSDSSEPIQMDEEYNSEGWMESDMPGLPFHAYDDLLTVFPRDINLDSPEDKGKLSPIYRSPMYQDKSKPLDSNQFPDQQSLANTPGARFTAVSDYARKTATLSSDVVDESTEPFPVQWEDPQDGNDQLKAPRQTQRLSSASFANVLPEKQPESPCVIEPAGGSQEKRQGPGVAPPTDLRKTSWMNGFMMFSRMHRKDYIESHPGTPTSHISKIMGQDWRQLSSAEQDVYREYARTYSLKFLQA